ncbi:MAG TPA: lactate utilization protein C [Burkholderiales bacterium]|nr:lactate utilization protein C [Burkholderiales bacterium]
MGSREEILAAIRKRQGRGGASPPAAEREQLQTYLRAHPRGPLPEVAGDLATRFCARAEASASTCDRVAAMAEAPGAVVRYLEAHGLPRSGCVWPSLAGLDWKAAGLELEPRAARGDDMIGVTGAFCALAETGTLAMVSGRDTPASASLLPETHIAVVPLARVVRHMEDAWDLMRAELGQLPRAVNYISGPSRTADIEQTLVLGAHGPYRVHIVLVG